MNNFIKQALKYGVVGIMNTLLTALTIWLLMRFAFQVTGDVEASSLAVSVSNGIGYIVGLVNSFIWNRKWTFKSSRKWRSDLFRFIVAFLICYIPQLLLVNALNTYVELRSFHYELLGREFVVSYAYVWQLAGIVFYTVLNFLLNKYYTFNK